jgi:hypothetical protein
MISAEKIKAEFIRISRLGYVENIKRDINDGAAGNTFEHHLGVTENNLKEADYDGFEIKTKKWLGKSATPYSLFTLKPSYPLDGDNYMRENWGVYDKRYPTIKRFSTSVFASRWCNVYKKNWLRLEVNRDEQKQIEPFQPSTLKNSACFSPRVIFAATAPCSETCHPQMTNARHCGEDSRRAAACRPRAARATPCFTAARGAADRPRAVTLTPAQIAAVCALFSPR